MTANGSWPWNCRIVSASEWKTTTSRIPAPSMSPIRVTIERRCRLQTGQPEYRRNCRWVSRSASGTCTGSPWIVLCSRRSSTSPWWISVITISCLGLDGSPASQPWLGRRLLLHRGQAAQARGQVLRRVADERQPAVAAGLVDVDPARLEDAGHGDVEVAVVAAQGVVGHGELLDPGSDLDVRGHLDELEVAARAQRVHRHRGAAGRSRARGHDVHEAAVAADVEPAR